MSKNKKETKQKFNFPKAKELPVFVYGTLLPGLRNYNGLLRGCTLMEEKATMKGKMYDNHGAYPVVDTTEDGVVHGMIIHIKPAVYQDVMVRLDCLEGYIPGHDNNLYERVVVDVKSVSGSVVKCYTYSKGAMFDRFNDSLPPIPGGDWVEHLKSNSATIHLDDTKIKFKSDEAVITSGAYERLSEEQVNEMLARHYSGDWGESKDKRKNNQALKNGDDSMMSVFTVDDVIYWVYTEWDRSVTTILLPSEW